MEKQQITVIAGTNREESNSAMVAGTYSDLLNRQGAEAKVLNLRDMPHDFLFSDMYGLRSQEVQRIIHDYLVKAEKLIFVIPEYNGGFPGVLKAFIDCLDPKMFAGKKAGLVGLSSGRAGSLLGMDQFTAILHYLRVQVHYSKLKLSLIETLIDNELKQVDNDTLKRLESHVAEILEF